MEEDVVELELDEPSSAVVPLAKVPLITIVLVPLTLATRTMDVLCGCVPLNRDS